MEFNQLGMPIGMFFSNRNQEQMPKTVKNVFMVKENHFICDICSERFHISNWNVIQDHLDDVHGEDKR